MKYFMNLVLVILVGFSSSLVLAADIIVAVPKSGITIPQAEPHRAKAISYFEMNRSTWEPKGVVTPSRLDQTTQFTKSESNRVSFNFGIGEWDSSIGFISPKLGFSYMTLKRSGFLGFANAGYPVSQDLALYQARLGLEWVSHNDLITNLRPHVGLSALPVWMQSAASQFDDGISEVRWMGEVNLGLTYNIRPVANSLGVALTGITLGIESTEALSPSELAGTGFVLGARISWN